VARVSRCAPEMASSGFCWRFPVIKIKRQFFIFAAQRIPRRAFTRVVYWRRLIIPN
jgi:hypothetical protein